MNGRGEFVVTAVGDATEIGKVAKKSTEQTSVETPLHMQLDKLAKMISKVGSVVSVAAFFIFLIHDILTNPAWGGKDLFLYGRNRAEILHDGCHFNCSSRS